MSEESSITGLGDSSASNPSDSGSASTPTTSGLASEPSGSSVPVSNPSDTPSSTASDSSSSGDVVLYLARIDDSFRYGENDDEVIVGREGKQFSRQEADKILESAKNNEVPLMERGTGELI